MDSPPIVSATLLQRELDRLMEEFEHQEQQRSQKTFEGLLAFVLIVVGGIIVIRLRTASALAPSLILALGFFLMRSVGRYLRWGPRRLASLDERLVRLAPQVAMAPRLRLKWQDRQRLQDRLFSCTPEVAGAIIPLLEVAGDKESLRYLQSLAGDGPYAHLLAARIHPEIRPIAEAAARSLQRKLDRETDAEILLRPGMNASANELLRPMNSSGSHAAEQLLRADPEDGSDR